MAPPFSINSGSASGARPGHSRPGRTPLHPGHSRPGRTPLHPGRFLESRFLRPAQISQDALARALGISRRRVNELVRGRRAFTPDTAVRLGRYFHTDPALWMVMQSVWDVHQAWRKMAALR